MPVYTYQCSACEAVADIRHSMGEVEEDCLECDTGGSLVRVPSTFSVSNTGQNNKKTTAKQRVDGFISDAKKELNQHRKDSRVDYEP